jgi:hypothetical protein
MAKMAAKPVSTVLAAMALGAAGALVSPGPTQRTTEGSRGAELARPLPNVVPEEVQRQPIDSASSVSSRTPPRSLAVKRPSAAESLGQEQKLLARARAALGRGELELATQELDRHAQLFPSGNLMEEREALRVVTLAQQGNLAAARARAARFRRTYPRSIQLGTIDAAVGERP